MNPVIFWWIDSDEFFLPITYEQVATIQRQRDVFSELHYGRYTYYPFHNESRLHRELYHGIRQSLERWI